MCAVTTALGNSPFWYRQNVVSEKFAAIGDRLDATKGEDLKTFEGCCRLLVMCSEASPGFRDYAWVTGLNNLYFDGVIPALPELK